MASPSAYHGIVIVDKPAEHTSHDVVAIARKLFQTKRVGHTGTLDPDATGVLVLCLGQATRLAEYLSVARKHYVATVTFGIETDTQDASGTVLAERDAAHLTAADIERLLPRFRGAIEQVPPMVSAVHHEGKRLYDLARQGVVVERQPRPVTIDTLTLTDWTAGTHPIATLEITCSTGTYIRTLAADLGAAAGTGAVMQTLRRTWVGTDAHRFTLEQAHTLEALRQRAGEGTLHEVVLPLTAAVAGWPTICLDAEQLTRLRNGIALDVAQSDEPEPVAALDAKGALAAVGRIEAGVFRPVKVLA